MKKAISVILQAVLFFLSFAVGSIFWHPFGIETTLSSTPPTVRLFVWDGMLLMLLLFGLIVLLEVVLKRLLRSVPWTTLALVLAAVLGLASKLGFITRDF